jgi:hypothetical protein
LELIVTALSILHINSGEGGPVFPIPLITKIIHGAKFKIKKSHLVAWNDPCQLGINLERLVRAGPPFCCSDNRIGLLKFSPKVDKVLKGRNPKDSDAVELVQCIRGWPKEIALSETESLQELGSETENEDSGDEIQLFQNPEKAVLRRCQKPGEIGTPAEKEPVPKIKPWSPKPVVNVKSFAETVEELSSQGERFSLQEAVATLRPKHGGTDWGCCLDVVKQLSLIRGRMEMDLEEDDKKV